MRIIKIIIGVVVVLCVAGGIYALIKSRQKSNAAASSEEESPPPIVSVEVGAIKTMTLHQYITSYGTVAPAPAIAKEPAASAMLAPMTAGVVTKVNVVEGQYVKQGEVILELNSASATLKYAEEEVARQKKLYAQQNTSLRNLQSAEAQLAPLRVTTPLSGTVVHLNTSVGGGVDLNSVVAEVVDMDRLIVSAEIQLSQSQELKIGEEAQILTEPPVAATLSFVSSAANTNNGTVQARARLAAASGLRPGQFVELRVTTGTHTNCLAVPEESVLTDVDGHSVIALVKDDTATQTPVTTGFRENGWVEIEGAGLKPGDSVVTVGAYGLPKTTKIKVAAPEAAETPQSNSPPAQ